MDLNKRIDGEKSKKTFKVFILQFNLATINRNESLRNVKVMAMDGAGASEAETCSEQGEILLPSSLSNLNYWP